MSAMTNTNWPDPTRPGVPLFPERDGWHHVGRNLLFWHSDIQKWVTESTIRGCKEPEDFAGDEYHGTVLTPTQINEMLAAERERAAKEAEKHRSDANPHAVSDWDVVQTSTANDIAKAIRNLGATP